LHLQEFTTTSLSQRVDDFEDEQQLIFQVIVVLATSEKGSNPRMWKVSTALIEMLEALPKKSTDKFYRALKKLLDAEGFGQPVPESQRSMQDYVSWLRK
jgi:hypothetical protein